MAVKNFKEKKKAALLALKLLPNKGVIGLGSGSTVDILASLIEPNSNQKFICVSKKAKAILKEKNAHFAGKNASANIAFDGADQIIASERNKIAIKGAGALDFTAEKSLDYDAKKLVLVMDASKLKAKTVCDVFVECKKPNVAVLMCNCAKMGVILSRVPNSNPHLKGKKNTFLYFKPANNLGLRKLEAKIEELPGVLGCGIFARKKFTLIIGRK